MTLRQRRNTVLVIRHTVTKRPFKPPHTQMPLTRHSLLRRTFPLISYNFFKQNRYRNDPTRYFMWNRLGYWEGRLLNLKV